MAELMSQSLRARWWCRYSSEAALEALAAAFKDACVTLGEFHEIFHRQLAASGAIRGVTPSPASNACTRSGTLLPLMCNKPSAVSAMSTNPGTQRRHHQDPGG